MNQQNQCSFPQLAIASIAMQEWGETYRPETAFANGTIFPELNLPFSAAGGRVMSGQNIRKEAKLR